MICAGVGLVVVLSVFVFLLIISSLRGRSWRSGVGVVPSYRGNHHPYPPSQVVPGGSRSGSVLVVE